MHKTLVEQKQAKYLFINMELNIPTVINKSISVATTPSKCVTDYLHSLESETQQGNLSKVEKLRHLI